MLYFTLTTIGLTVLLIISGFSFKSVLERKQKKTKKQKRRKNTRYEQLHQESDSEDNYKVFSSWFFENLKFFVHAGNAQVTAKEETKTAAGDHPATDE